MRRPCILAIGWPPPAEVLAKLVTTTISINVCGTRCCARALTDNDLELEREFRQSSHFLVIGKQENSPRNVSRK